MRPSKPLLEMRNDAERRITVLQGGTRLANGTFKLPNGFSARILDERGLTRGEFMRSLGGELSHDDDDVFDTVRIAYRELTPDG